MKTLGELIRSRRAMLGMNLSELSRRIGVTRTYIDRIERGQDRASDRVIFTIAGILDLPPDALFAAAGRLPPELQARVGDVITAYRQQSGKRRSRQKLSGQPFEPHGPEAA